MTPDAELKQALDKYISTKFPGNFERKDMAYTIVCASKGRTEGSDALGIMQFIIGDQIFEGDQSVAQQLLTRDYAGAAAIAFGIVAARHSDDIGEFLKTAIFAMENDSREALKIREQLEQGAPDVISGTKH